MSASLHIAGASGRPAPPGGLYVCHTLQYITTTF